MLRWGTLQNINTVARNAAGIAEEANNALLSTSKLLGISAGEAGIPCAAYDAVEALVCKDGVCFWMSVISGVANSVSMATSFLPGVNASNMVTVPMSLSCKVFVAKCKHGTLPLMKSYR